MIVSASRRTDIPAFFSDWFFKRIAEKYALVRNPMNIHQVGRIDLSPEVVDCIVFWSKDPKPMLNDLDKLKDYMYYFQFTLNAYDDDIEKNLPPLRERIETFKTLSDKIGRQRVIWRYDPIILNDRYTVDRHIQNFSHIAEELKDCTEKCTISFIDMYSKIAQNIRGQNIHEICAEDQRTIAGELASIAHSHGLTIDTCAEKIDLSEFGIEHACCIDSGLISRLCGCALNIDKDKNQRPECGCVSSIDLGSYNTCQHGCIYCYANHNADARRRSLQTYDKNSPLLCSRLDDEDKITERKVESQKDLQTDLFDRL